MTRTENSRHKRFARALQFTVLALLFAMALPLHAQNFAVDVTIDNVNPDIELNDTSTDEANWEICIDNGCATLIGAGPSFNEGFHIGWDDTSVGGLPFVIERGAADYVLFVDSLERIGINTSTPSEDLQVDSPSPAIRINDTSSGAGQVDLNLSTNTFAIEGNTGADIIQLDTQAPHQSIDIDSVGNIGMGATSTGASLYVRRGDGTAQILVDEDNPTLAARTLFKLSNSGNTKFEIEEVSSANTWAFTNSGFDFRVSLQGSGDIEFRVDNEGNAALAGTLTEGSDVNSKTDIRDIDVQDVLDKVTTIPVSRWQYKDTEGVDHIGPMAQDFYSAFGLGATEKGIASIDAGGVAMASIQALAERNTALASEVARLSATVKSLKAENDIQQDQFSAELSSLRSMLVDIQNQQSRVVLTSND